MKLSEKGLLKILDGCYFDEEYDEYVLPSINRKENLFEIQDTTFEQDDFTGAVILTVEEAQAIRSKLHDLLLFAKGKDHYQSNVKKDLSLLWGRIIQAEKSK